jgi:solute carrier family 35 protein E1
MLACSSDISASNVLGLVCAFGSTLIFVSQNIFFKKIMPTNAETTSSKLDKTNLLYFSSGMAFLLMVPVWLYSDAWRLVLPTWRIAFYFFLNGTVHYAQNLLAFAILGSTSPVTYSIASLVKRIAVICLAIIWFKQSVHGTQAVGIALTALGLLMYNNAKRDVERGERRMRQDVLPISEKAHSSPKVQPVK